jgi:hypothetical protein
MRPFPKPFRNLTQEPTPELTTILGLRGKDGIVLACDSQASYKKGIDMKRLNVNKLFPIGTFDGSTNLALAGAGDADHITLLAEALTKGLTGRSFSDEELRSDVEKILLELHKKHNIERSRFFGLPEVEMFFSPMSILGAKLREPSSMGTQFGLYLLRPDGWVSPIEKYETVGSGGVFADFLLSQFDSGLKAIGEDLRAASIRFWETYAPTLLQQVKDADMYSGGRTRVAAILR